MEEQAKKLAEIRAERARLAAADAERDAAEDIAGQIEAEARGLADDQAWAKARAEHGKRIKRVDSDLGAVIVKRPHHHHFRRFQESAETTYAEFDRLVRPSLVHPAPDVFDKMLEEQPALLARVAAAVCELAGVRLKELGGKS